MVWGHSDTSKLQSLVNNLLFQGVGKRLKHSLSNLFDSYGVLSINETYKLSMITLIRNYMINHSRNDKYKKFYVMSERCKSNGEIRLINPIVRYARTKCAFAYRIVSTWNALSRTLRRFDARCFKLRAQLEIVAERDDARMYIELYHR